LLYSFCYRITLTSRANRRATDLVILDSTHRRWILATLALAAGAVSLHLYLGWGRPGGLTGGTAAGLWYGVAGSALMLFAGALSLHRRLSSWRWLPIRRWLGSRQAWLRAHIWLGLLGVLLVWCHSGYSWGGPLEVALWVVLLVTVLSGVLGLVLQALLPRIITNRVEAEAPYEQIEHICGLMRRDADEAVEAALARPGVEASVQAELRSLHLEVRAFLGSRFDPTSPLASPLRAEQPFAQVRATAGLEAVADVVDRLQALCEERRQLGEQVRLHRLLHVWLLVHIPITVALLILGGVHAVMSVYW
jgi:hypothetical protein